MANGAQLFGAGLRGLTEALVEAERRRQERAATSFSALQEAGAVPRPVRGDELARLRRRQGFLGRLFGTGLPPDAVEIGTNVFEFQEPPTFADLGEFAGVEVPEALAGRPVSTSDISRIFPDIIERGRENRELERVFGALGGETDIAAPSAREPTLPVGAPTQRPSRGTLRKLPTRGRIAQRGTGIQPAAEVEQEPTEERRPEPTAGRRRGAEQRIGALDRELAEMERLLATTRGQSARSAITSRITRLRQERNRLGERQERLTREQLEPPSNEFEQFARSMFGTTVGLSPDQVQAVIKKRQEEDLKQKEDVETAEARFEAEQRRSQPLAPNFRRAFNGARTVGEAEKGDDNFFIGDQTDSTVQKRLDELSSTTTATQNVVRQTRDIENILETTPEAVGVTGSAASAFNSVMAQLQNVGRLLETGGAEGGFLGIGGEEIQQLEDVGRSDLGMFVSGVGRENRLLASRITALAFEAARAVNRGSSRVPVALINLKLQELAPSSQDPGAVEEAIEDFRRRTLQDAFNESFGFGNEINPAAFIGDPREAARLRADGEITERQFDRSLKGFNDREQKVARRALEAFRQRGVEPSPRRQREQRRRQPAIEPLRGEREGGEQVFRSPADVKRAFARGDITREEAIQRLEPFLNERGRLEVPGG